MKIKKKNIFYENLCTEKKSKIKKYKKLQIEKKFQNEKNFKEYKNIKKDPYIRLTHNFDNEDNYENRLSHPFKEDLSKTEDLKTKKKIHLGDPMVYNKSKKLQRGDNKKNVNLKIQRGDPMIYNISKMQIGEVINEKKSDNKFDIKFNTKKDNFFDNKNFFEKKKIKKIFREKKKKNLKKNE